MKWTLVQDCIHVFDEFIIIFCQKIYNKFDWTQHGQIQEFSEGGSKTLLDMLKLFHSYCNNFYPTSI